MKFRAGLSIAVAISVLGLVSPAFASDGRRASTAGGPGLPLSAQDLTYLVATVGILILVGLSLHVALRPRTRRRRTRLSGERRQAVMATGAKAPTASVDAPS